MIYNLSIPAEQDNFKTKVDYLIEKGAKVELKKINPKRTISQNSYLHLAFSWFGLEIGYTLDESKQLIKSKFLSYEKNGEVFIRQTSKLNTKEMTDFIEKFRKYSSENGVYIPAPNEREKLEWLKNEVDKQNKWL